MIRLAKMLEKSFMLFMLRIEPSRTRTCDPLVKSQLLYRLSYRPTSCLVEGILHALCGSRKRSVSNLPFTD
jgi:hypothetical protein